MVQPGHVLHFRPGIFHDFKWIIVDDGTRELVLSRKPFFPRYTWKENGGKHTAVNIGIQAGFAPKGPGRQGDLRYSSPKGTALYNRELACFDVPLKVRLKAAFNALRFTMVAIARDPGFFR